MSVHSSPIVEKISHLSQTFLISAAADWKKSSTASQQPRKLLVHLASEQATTDILPEAKKLRKSDNPAVATAVFINPDHSPAKVKLTFVQRQRRRASQLRRTHPDASVTIVPTDDGHGDQPTTNYQASTNNNVPTTVASTSTDNFQSDQSSTDSMMGINSDTNIRSSFFPAK